MVERKVSKKGEAVKRLFMVYILYVGALYAEESYISRGGLTEATFIIQNKQNELSDYILRIKKLIAHCMLLNKEEKRSPALKKEVTCYQCSFKQKLFAGTVEELEKLLELLNQFLTDLSKKEQFTHSFVRSRVDTAFLIKRKIDTESLLIDHLLKIDKEQESLRKAQSSLKQSLKKSDDLAKVEVPTTRTLQALRKEEGNGSFLKRVIKRLQASLARNRKNSKNLQASLRTINGELYKDREHKEESALLVEVL